MINENSMNERIDIKKVPQNIVDLIGEIGEKMSLFKLFELTHLQNNLEIFKNYSERGYDIGIRNLKPKQDKKEKVKIEVKTRQHLITTTSDKSKNSCHFTLTENEKKSADFLIGYWIEFNCFFIVPTKDLTPIKSNKKVVYKHVVSRLKKPKNNIEIYSEASMPYLENWNSILEFFNGK